MQHGRIPVALIFILSLLLSACGNSKKSESPEILDLKDRFYWAECDVNSTVESAESIRFHKFSTKGIANIRDVAGKQEYVWLKATFYLPESLQGKSLGLLITYLHFAEKTWVNGTYIGGYGSFPPNEKSALWGTHFYTIPHTLLKTGERNSILMKVYCKGRTGISDTVLLGEQTVMSEKNSVRTFLQVIIYVFVTGSMFSAAILFLLIFIRRTKEREYFSFSMLCLASVVFVTPFFGSVLPINFPNDVPFLLFIKLTLCEGLYLMVFFVSSLIIEFAQKEELVAFRNVRLSILISSTLITLFSPSYEKLIRICPLALTLSIIQLLSGFIYIAVTPSKREHRRNFFILILSFVPLIISMFADFIIKIIFEKIDYPYLAILGWLVTIIAFIIILSIRYSKAITQNEYLNIQLRREVDKQTLELSEKNTQLTEEIHRSEIDLEMASIVQKKFFPYPPKVLRGWDIAVSYNPLDKVSGDMYDFYIEGNTLNGFSLFDVSGHGIAASLVTMLAKNIIYQAFKRNRKKKETVSRTLYEINNTIIEAKGDIENYLTGLMFRFEPFEENDDCKVEMANAGHPNPILYSAKSNICDEIESGDSEDHHGAIGIDFITVSFPQINFTMSEDDILVFYTDGLSESTNKEKEQFGKERIKRIIKESYAKDAQSIMEDIIDELQLFTKGEKRNDDITIVVLKRENTANFIEELGEI